MRKISVIIVAALVLALLAACAGNIPGNNQGTNPGNNQGTNPGNNTGNNQEGGNGKTADDQAAKPESTAADQPVSTPADEPGSTADGNTESTPGTQPGGNTEAHKKVLVVVFSATGTTKGVADKIAAIEDADVYEIKAKQEYTQADLNWNDRNSRSTKEQNDKRSRPEIGSERISLDGYEKVYIGFPIWWGEEPRIVDTFVESYSFDGITVIPFCTSSSSGIGRSGRNLEENAKSGKWLDGKRFPGGVSEAELKKWIDSMK